MQQTLNVLFSHLSDENKSVDALNMDWSNETSRNDPAPNIKLSNYFPTHLNFFVLGKGY